MIVPFYFPVVIHLLLKSTKVRPYVCKYLEINRPSQVPCNKMAIQHLCRFLLSGPGLLRPALQVAGGDPILGVFLQVSKPHTGVLSPCNSLNQSFLFLSSLLAIPPYVALPLQSCSSHYAESFPCAVWWPLQTLTSLVSTALPVQPVSHALLQLATSSSYSTSKIVCLTLLFSN